ncbi:MAG: hypothetical protein M3487_07170 [Actinomycetota bacterium]|nr:hypothetical protein [Actinomycetota bacterium]
MLRAEQIAAGRGEEVQCVHADGIEAAAGPGRGREAERGPDPLRLGDRQASRCRRRPELQRLAAGAHRQVERQPTGAARRRRRHDLVGGCAVLDEQLDEPRQLVTRQPNV